MIKGVLPALRLAGFNLKNLKMKKITIMLICCASALAVSAQDTQTTTPSKGTNEIQTIFGHCTGTCKIPLGFFIEMNGGYSMFGSKSAFLPGMSMGMILNHHWTIGATGSFIGNSHGVAQKNIYYDSTQSKMRGADLEGGYGGLLLEYILLPNSKVHVAFPLMIGGGFMGYTNSGHHNDSIIFNNSSKEFHHGHNYISSDHFFVIEPGVRLEFNMLKSLRLGLTLSYRYSPDFKLQNTSADLINQFTAKLSLRLGKF
jgi:hypothetical protein